MVTCILDKSVNCKFICVGAFYQANSRKGTGPNSTVANDIVKTLFVSEFCYENFGCCPKFFNSFALLREAKFFINGKDGDYFEQIIVKFKEHMYLIANYGWYECFSHVGISC